MKFRSTHPNKIITKKIGKELLSTGVVLIAFSLVVFASSDLMVMMTRQACPPDVTEGINLHHLATINLRWPL
jgi:hypothetical protein